MPRDHVGHQAARLPVITCTPTVDLTRLDPCELRQAVGQLLTRPVGSRLQLHVDQHPGQVDYTIPSLLAEAAVARALHLDFVGDPDHVGPWLEWMQELVARRLLPVESS